MMDTILSMSVARTCDDMIDDMMYDDRVHADMTYGDMIDDGMRARD